ncbi:MAG TPA: ABC transporter ATP-binding protein [Thermoanaerobaculia bacterium]
MSLPAVRVEGIGKRYEIGRLRRRNRTLKEALAETARTAGRAAGAWMAGAPWRAEGEGWIWALRDVSCQVEPGEVLGILGANGAGKSTLLKILSRVTEPTTGHAEIRGRVGSLLEVGTGFHPELTGRENVYLNGAILGMRRTEIARKFDEIVAFAEVERFLDTPVKRYSSGMYLRLAFAVAAHLEPEILMVDEVLAVGDARFQRKCLGKMREVSSREGRTVLFVSHNLGAVQRLCSRCLLLEDGALVAQGPTGEIVARYLGGRGPAALPGQWIDLSGVERSGTGEARVEAVRYRGGDPAAAFQPSPEGPLEIELSVAADAPREAGNLAVTFYDAAGTKLVNADTLALGRTLALRPGRNRVRLRIEALHLNPGVYALGFWIASPAGVPWDFADAAVRIEVVETGWEGPGTRPDGDGVVPCRFELWLEEA